MTIIYLKQKDIPRVREELIKKQNGICPICHREIDRPCLDHFHKKKVKGSGLCRGVLCLGCNSWLGKLENSLIRCKIPYNILPLVLNNVSKYIQTSTDYMHPSEWKESDNKECFPKSKYNKIKKIFFDIYPNKKVIPEYPVSKKVTKEFEQIILDYEKYLENAGDINAKNTKKKKS